jgi:hypothetical protein
MGGDILMKYVKVVIDMVLEVPDEMEIMTPEDEDELPYVRINGQDYIPLHDWLKRTNNRSWTSLNEDEHEEFDELAHMGTVNTSIQVILEKEFREALPQQ